MPSIVGVRTPAKIADKLFEAGFVAAGAEAPPTPLSETITIAGSTCTWPASAVREGSEEAASWLLIELCRAPLEVAELMGMYMSTCGLFELRSVT